MTVNDVLQNTNDFIEEHGITNEDIKQELYLQALEVNTDELTQIQLIMKLTEVYCTMTRNIKFRKENFVSLCETCIPYHILEVNIIDTVEVSVVSRDMLLSIINTLTPSEATVILSKYIKGSTLFEIARLLNNEVGRDMYKQNDIKTLEYKALEKLRQSDIANEFKIFIGN